MSNTKYKERSGVLQDSFFNTLQQNNTKTYVNTQASSGQKDVVVASVSGLAIGDSIVIYDGEDSFETCVIENIVSLTLTMTANLVNTYPVGSVIGRYLGFLDTVNNKYQRLLAPDLGTGADGAFVSSGDETWNSEKNYTSVTIQSGHTITVDGNFDIKCQGTFEIQAGGKLSAKGKGHAGGVGRQYGGNQGASQTGAGTNSPDANGGGGGGASYGAASTVCGGGGGGYGSAGQNGSDNTNYPNYTGDGGVAYNDAGLTTFTIAFLKGSGGGSGTSVDNIPGSWASGGAGGGIIRIHAKNFVCAGEIDCDGNPGATITDHPVNGIAGGAGGGSGGTIFIQALQLATLGTSLIHSSGGAGSNGMDTASQVIPSRKGGNGGAGRIRIEAGKITGTTTPTHVTGYTNNLGGHTRYGWYHTAKVNVLNDSFFANAYVKIIDSVAANPTSGANSGQKVIALSSGNAGKFNAGDKVFIYENEMIDIGVVDTVGATSITLLTNLAYTYTTSAVVVRVDASAQCSLVASGEPDNFIEMDLNEVKSLGTNLWLVTFSMAVKSNESQDFGKEFIGRVKLQGKDNDTVDVYAKDISWSYF